jgi:hypothetical protein
MFQENLIPTSKEDLIAEILRRLPELPHREKYRGYLETLDATELESRNKTLKEQAKLEYEMLHL